MQCVSDVQFMIAEKRNSSPPIDVSMRRETRPQTTGVIISGHTAICGSRRGGDLTTSSGDR